MKLLVRILFIFTIIVNLAGCQINDPQRKKISGTAWLSTADSGEVVIAGGTADVQVEAILYAIARLGEYIRSEINSSADSFQYRSSNISSLRIGNLRIESSTSLTKLKVGDDSSVSKYEKVVKVIFGKGNKACSLEGTQYEDYDGKINSSFTMVCFDSDINDIIAELKSCSISLHTFVYEEDYYVKLTTSRLHLDSLTENIAKESIGKEDDDLYKEFLRYLDSLEQTGKR